MTDQIEQLCSRLDRLAKRRDREGFYTDGNICEEAAAVIRSLSAKVAELEDALIWCSAASDFAPGGFARAGWEKACQPLLVRAAAEKPK